MTLNELAMKAKITGNVGQKTYCNFEFQQRSHTMTDDKSKRGPDD